MLRVQGEGFRSYRRKRGRGLRFVVQSPGYRVEVLEFRVHRKNIGLGFWG